ncbi:TELO2-interacting protein 1 homolog isoform X2 [Artemia franciscana]|uniref:TELO2-interacting protein 1 homolog isoform X2 n=1 Tax=Artemia franciscana TaxID=6661 RepID=UPI0032D9EAEE
MDAVMNLVKSPSDETVMNLLKKLKSPDGIELLKIRKFRECLIPVLNMVLRSAGFLHNEPVLFKRRETVVENLVQILSLSLSQDSFENKEVFLSILSHLSLFLDRNAQGVNFGEDVKLQIIKCFRILLFTTVSKVKEDLFSKDGSLTLAVLIHALLSSAKDEKSKELKLEAVKMVNMLFEVETSSPLQKSKVLSNVLPGISKTCMEIALQETGQKVISESLIAIRNVLSHTLRDKLFCFPEKEDFSSLSLQTEGKDTAGSGYPSLIWVNFTQPRMKIVIEKVSALKSSESFIVKEALLNVAEEVLLNCRRSLHSSIFHLLDVCVTFLSDDLLGNSAENLIAKLRQSLDLQVIDITYERLYFVCLDALRTIRLGNWPIGFRYLIDTSSIEIFKQICAHTGQNASLSSIIETLDGFLCDPFVSKESTLLVRLYCLQGLKLTELSTDDIEINYTRNLVEEVVAHLKPESSNEVSTLRDISFSSLRSCVLLETLGALSNALGKKFQPFLIRTLYPVLSAAGRKDERTFNAEYISKSAVKVLHIFAESTGQCSLPQFLQENSDYIVSQLCINMSDESELSNVSLAVRSVAHLGGDVGIQCANAAVKTATDLLKTKGIRYARLLLLCKAYGEIVNAKRKKKAAASETTIEMPMKFERGRVTKFMVEHEKNFKMSENLETSSLSEEEEQPRCEEKELLLYAENDEEKKLVPENVEIAAEIVRVSGNYINNPDAELVCMSLNAISSSLMVLEEDEDALLPAIHKLWGPLLGKLKQKNIRTMIPTVQLLGQMVVVSGRFLRARIVKEALPILISFAETESNKKLEPFSMERKLLKQILEVFAIFLRGLELSVKENLLIFAVLEKFLNIKADEEIRIIAANIFKECAFEPDLCDQVWLVLQETDGSLLDINKEDNLIVRNLQEISE